MFRVFPFLVSSPAATIAMQLSAFYFNKSYLVKSDNNKQAARYRDTSFFLFLLSPKRDKSQKGPID